jgi:hypothetical protein
MSEMEGVDLAFYKNRAYYHTRFDSIAYAEGGPRALQAMIETIRFGGLGLLNANVKANEKHNDPVYFDGTACLVVWITLLTRLHSIWEVPRPSGHE